MATVTPAGNTNPNPWGWLEIPPPRTFACGECARTCPILGVPACPRWRCSAWTWPIGRGDAAGASVDVPVRRVRFLNQLSTDTGKPLACPTLAGIDVKRRVLSIALVFLSACSAAPQPEANSRATDTTQTPDQRAPDEIVSLQPSDESAIYAAATFYLATEANTFDPDHRFSELVVVERLRVGAANLDGLPSAGANLTDEDRAAIEASLSALGRVRFVSSRSDFFDNNVRGSALLMLAPVVVEDQRVARVGATLQCESHCAVWTTIDVISTDGEWHAVSDGPRTIS